MKKIILLLMLQLTVLIAADFTISESGTLTKESPVPATTETVVTTPTTEPVTTAEGPYTVIPGLYGFGTDTRAAYGGSADPVILHVNTLDGGVSNTDSTHGSFAWAVTRTFPRIVVFDVSGVISSSSNLEVKSPYIYIAGQTAPGHIVYKGHVFFISTHDVVMQHMTFRVAPGTTNVDGVSIYGSGAYNVVVDHCSVSWATDELMSPTHGAHTVTMSNCILSQCLKDHSTGSLVSDAKNISIIGNLYAHNSKRHPSVNISSNVAFYNNVVYDWGWAIGEFNGLNSATQDPNGTIHISYIGNYCKSGASTSSNAGAHHLIRMEPYAEKTTNHVSMRDNILDGKTITGVDVYTGEYNWPYSVVAEINVPNYTPYSASNTLSTVLANAGARSNDRDSVDAQIVNDVVNGTGSQISSTPSMPNYPQNRSAFVPVSSPHAMYDQYYTNLEHQLNQLSKNLISQ